MHTNVFLFYLLYQIIDHISILFYKNINILKKKYAYILLV